MGTRKATSYGREVAERLVTGLVDAGVTILTASAAASQGREVFAVPGPITSPVSKAPHFLLKNGAKLVESTDDILEELKIEQRVKSGESKKVLPETKEEKKLLEILEKEGLDIDSLVRISGIGTGKVLALLTEMELKGLVKNVGGIYTKSS